LPALSQLVVVTRYREYTLLSLSFNTLPIQVVSYVPHFAFEKNADNTGIDQSFKGKRMNDILALVYKQISGKVNLN
jgi:hypothetical protein